MIRQEAKQAERKVKHNCHVLCINIGICIGNEINQELLPTCGIRAGLSAITPGCHSAFQSIARLLHQSANRVACIACVTIPS